MEDVRPLTRSMTVDTHSEPVLLRPEPCPLSLAAVAALLQEKGFLIDTPQAHDSVSHSWEPRRGWSR